eukprot:CAMPEP_0178414728 /NCGR_PEP_ID=MMETSP0689_2-20121128/23186_1 /TAXON_ID=160604 /ORGANISM="Amphidinium massartii, Strain CS-259" /LENGTH=285 /DNA_ID=CAMNT_0020036027 /DNA_START=80 /DNA_END=939 /DNA_ORIENTATION=-
MHGQGLQMCNFTFGENPVCQAPVQARLLEARAFARAARTRARKMPMDPSVESSLCDNSACRAAMLIFATGGSTPGAPKAVAQAMLQELAPGVQVQEPRQPPALGPHHARFLPHQASGSSHPALSAKSQPWLQEAECGVWTLPSLSPWPYIDAQVAAPMRHTSPQWLTVLVEAPSPLQRFRSRQQLLQQLRGAAGAGAASSLRAWVQAQPFAQSRPRIAAAALCSRGAPACAATSCGKHSKSSCSTTELHLLMSLRRAVCLSPAIQAHRGTGGNRWVSRISSKSTA